MRRLSPLAAVAMLLVVGTAQAAATRLGVLPLRLAPGYTTDLATDALLATLSDSLCGDLREGDVGQVTRLAWPTALRGDDRPTFETLVGLGHEAGCNGVVVLTAAAVEFTDKTTRLPLVGESTNRHALLRLTGGVIDVASGAAVANLDQTQKKDARGGRGPAIDSLLRAGVGSREFDASPMGAVVAALRPALVKDIKEALPRLADSAIEPPPQRPNQPADASFELAEWPTQITAGYGRRDTIAVVNRGKSARAFVIRPVSAPPGIFGDVLGLGAADQPCTLGPGQWKYVRLVLNAPKPVGAGDLVLGLWSAAADAAPRLDGPPSDKATVHVGFDERPAMVQFQVVNQDPATLAYTCRVTNESDRDVTGLQLRPEPNDGSVELSPEFGGDAIHGTVVPAKGSLTLRVMPRFRPGVRSMDVKLVGWLGVDSTHAWLLHFEIPAGKDVYLGTGHTTACQNSNFQACVNQQRFNFGSNWNDNDDNGTSSRPGHGTDGDDPNRDNNNKDDDGWSLFKGTWVDTVTSWLGSLNGMTVRPSVAERLPELPRDTSEQPITAASRAWRGFGWCAPDSQGKTTAWFAAAASNSRNMHHWMRLSQRGHEALWLHLAARERSDQAVAAWVDSAAGKGSNVALRTSESGMDRWHGTVYLTDHAKGVDDPVVATSGEKLLAVAWCDLREGSDIRLRLSRDDAASFEPEIRLPLDAGEQQSWPQICYAKGGLQVAYVSAVGGARRVLTRALDDKGQAGAAPTVLSHPGVPCGEPRIATKADGSLAAVWREGDGAASEIWFASSADGVTWGEARRLTNDAVYSEYPRVGFGADGLWVTWHGDGKGLTDLGNTIESRDGGVTWSTPRALPTVRSATERAWLGVNIQLQWPRSSYKPFTLRFLVNDREVGRLNNVIPDGNYLFEVPREVMPTLASRLPKANIRVEADGCSGAHYLLTTSARLIVKRRFSQIPVVAASQEEADRLAESVGAELNHDQVDLVLTANNVTALPDAMPAGKSLTLPVQVHNVGEKPASNVRIAAYAADPRDPLAGGKLPRLGEVVVGKLAIGESRTANLTVLNRQAATGRLYVAVTAAEPDAYDADNLWTEHFVVGEERQRPPLLGTDLPDTLYAPALLPNVQLPNLPALRDLLAQPDLASLYGRAGWPLPAMPSVNGYLSQALSGLRVPGVEDLFPGLPRLPGVPSVPGLPGLPRIPGLP